jgi:hypothetical protein
VRNVAAVIGKGEWREMKEIALVLGLLSGLVGVFSAIAFMKGAVVVPWSKQTWGGNTPAEQAVRNSAAWWNKVGIGTLLAAFALSAASSIAGYLV